MNRAKQLMIDMSDEARAFVDDMVRDRDFEKDPITRMDLQALLENEEWDALLSSVDRLDKSERTSTVSTSSDESRMLLLLVAMATILPQIVFAGEGEVELTLQSATASYVIYGTERVELEISQRILAENGMGLGIDRKSPNVREKVEMLKERTMREVGAVDQVIDTLNRALAFSSDALWEEQNKGNERLN